MSEDRNYQTVGTFEEVEVNQLYRDYILDHYKDPRNQGLNENCPTEHDTNPSCGDEITMSVCLNEEGIIEDIKFKGEGCAISQATASILSEEMIGENFDRVKGLDKEEMEEIIGVSVHAGRIKCLTLSMNILKNIVYNQIGEEMED